MKIQFTRAGGFSGLLSEVRLDLDELGASERAELEGLVRRADFFAQPAELRAPHPDAFQYVIVVEDGERRHQVLVDERGAPDNLRPLIERLSRLARR